VKHAQFRSQFANIGDDDREILTADDLDAMIAADGDDETSETPKPDVPMIPLAKAGHDVSQEPRGQPENAGEWVAGAPNAKAPNVATPIPLATLRGNAKVGGVSVNNFLADKDGKSLRLSVGDIEKVAFIRPGVAAPKTAITSAANFDKTVRAKLADLLGKKNLATNGIDTWAPRLMEYAKSAVARYTADPSLIEKDKFYEQWCYVTGELSKETGISQDRVAAAMSNLSAGTTAAYNLRYGVDLAHIVADQTPLQSDTGDPSRDLATSVLRTDTVKALRDTASDKAKKGAAGKALADNLNYAADMIESGEAKTINDLPGDAAARFAHLFRKSSLFQRYKIPADPRMGPEWTDLARKDGSPGDQPENHAGFGVSKGYENYAKAVNVLRGYDIVKGDDGKPKRVPFTASDAVQEVKTRNFLNNIIDPMETHGSDSLTVDYHAMNSTTGSLGGADGEKSSAWNGSVTVAGVQIGVRAHVADAIRTTIPYFRKALGDPNLSALRAQEILWAEWKRGLEPGTTKWDPGPKGYIPPVWRGYDGVAHPLLDLRSPTRKLRSNVA
jgi:hypothetical protein